MIFTLHLGTGIRQVGTLAPRPLRCICVLSKLFSRSFSIGRVGGGLAAAATMR
jgi:hypothetical protein